MWPHKVHTAAVPFARVTREGAVEVEQENDAAVQWGRRREGPVERGCVCELQLAVINNCSLLPDGQIIVRDLRRHAITVAHKS